LPEGILAIVDISILLSGNNELIVFAVFLPKLLKILSHIVEQPLFTARVHTVIPAFSKTVDDYWPALGCRD
jgi:hypothetical protein